MIFIMINELFKNNVEYNNLIKTIKQNIKQSQLKAIYKVNYELINLYYNIGKEIVINQKKTNWGNNLIGQIEKDLKKEFSGVGGFSRTNLFYMRKLFIFFGELPKVPQLVGQLPWGHIRLILDKINNKTEAFFYIKETIDNNWSRIVLSHQIELKLFLRKGKIINNFKQTISNKKIPNIQSFFKNNYVFDFLDLSSQSKEKEIEIALVNNIMKFILELGKGFAFVNKQYKIIIENEEYYVDLLFYNYILKRFVIIELKTTEFKPEHVGQIGFYISVIDDTLKTKTDNETIGLIICKHKNKMIVEYALKNINKPMGVAEYKFSEIPKQISKYLPKAKEIKGSLNNLNN
jgi:predicted nuclease of restriction endonuclease-like (RecB) superfamily